MSKLAPEAFIGIDPGASGAIAFFNASGLPTIVHDMPNMTDAKGKHVDVLALQSLILKEIRSIGILGWAHDCPVLATMEDAWIMGSDGRLSGASFVRSIVEVQTLFRILGIELFHVKPQTWKAHFDLTHQRAPSELSKPAKQQFARRAKAAAKDKARAIVGTTWPHLMHSVKRKMDADRAEACLIGKWSIDNRPDKHNAKQNCK